MNSFIRMSLRNPYAVTVMAMAALVVGIFNVLPKIPIDILPVFKSPAVQVLTFYGGMPAESIEKGITNRMERWVGQSNGMRRQESRSIVGASIVRNYFRDDIDPNGALTQVNSLALAVLPNLPPGTLPPVVLPFDPTSTTPVCLVALDSQTQTESILYDVGRYEVRNMIMANPGAVAPVVYGGKLRAVMLYLDRVKMQARGLSPLDVMDSMSNYNVFLPNGSVKMGDIDFAIDSNSMYDLVQHMEDMPIRDEPGNRVYLQDVGTPRDAALIQTNIVRVNGRRQVYIPVYRQLGASTLSVVDTVRSSLGNMEERLTRPGIGLKLVMDQSVYVRNSINALEQEGILGALLCSLVILVFLGEWRMTLIAILTLPLAITGAIICLYATGNTINVMTLGGLALAIGPMVDTAIICLENTHRHLKLDVEPDEAAFLGSSEVAMPALIATLCTFLVLAPLALMEGMGQFLFRPMALSVAFGMICAYLLAMSLVPSYSSLLLPRHSDSQHGLVAGIFARWERVIERGIGVYTRALGHVLRHRVLTIGLAYGLLAVVLIGLSPRMRREFFPEVDSGSFEMAVRAPSGTRIELTNNYIAKVENKIRDVIDEHDLQLVLSEIGLTADWSAAYTPNAGPMDAIIKVQLAEHRRQSAQQHVDHLRKALHEDPRFKQLEFAFNTGGLIRGALNEGKSTPINIRVTGKDKDQTFAVARRIKEQVTDIPGIVDARVIQRMNYPQFTINVDRAKAADLGLTQDEVMKNVVAAVNSSISFNKKNFWIDPVSKNQYFVGVMYPEANIESLETLLNISMTSKNQTKPVPLRTIATIERTTVPTEVKHINIQPTIDVTMGVSQRDLGHVADDVAQLLNRFGKPDGEGAWAPYVLHDPEESSEQSTSPGPKVSLTSNSSEPNSTGSERAVLSGSKIVLSGEYERMQDTFYNLFIGLGMASLLIYFLMVALVRSWVVPLTVMLAVPLSLIGVLLLLYLTETAVNVQSLLGVIFVVGINVSNAVLLTDWAQQLRRTDGVDPTTAIREAARIRVRPVTMTALAAFFAMVPTALAFELGSEANAPLGRAIVGGLLAVEPATLFVVPCLYSLMVRDKRRPDASRPVDDEGPLPELAPEL